MVFELASAQRRQGADVEVWTLNAIRAGSTEVFDGLPVRYFMPDPLIGFARSFRLEKELGLLPRGSILHAHNTYNPLNLQVGRAAARHGHRAFYHPHGALDPALFSGWDFKSFKKRFYIHWFSAPNLNRAAGVFALTPLERQQLLSLGVTVPVHVISNGISPVGVGSVEAGAELRRVRGIDAHQPVVLFIGRITSKKKLEDIIHALSLMGVQSPHLLIGGNPIPGSDYGQVLLSHVRQWGCAARVHWLGFLDEAAKAAAYAAADVFVHASESEGMAMAILEAMDAALPVVVTRGCYMSTAASAGALVQCEQGPEALARALLPLLRNRVAARAQGQVGQAYVRREHDWDHLAQTMLRLYQEGMAAA